MTIITRIPGVPDPTLQPVIPSFGLSMTHLWRPRSFTGAFWDDEIGALHLQKQTAGATVTQASEGGTQYLHASSATRFVAPGSATITPAELRTIVAVVKIGPADTADANFVINAGTSAISLNTAGAASSTPSGLATTIPTDKWHILGLSVRADGSLDTFVDSYSQNVGTPSGPTNALRIFGSGTAGRTGRIALAFASSEAVLPATFTTTVAPAIRGALHGLEFG